MNSDYKMPVALRLLGWGFFLLFISVIVVSVTWSGHVAGTIFLVWLLDALLLGMALVINKSFRENLILRFARIRVRDEMEEQDVCRAMRSSFLFMIAVLVLLTGVSTFQSQATSSHSTSLSFLAPSIFQTSWKDEVHGMPCEEDQEAQLDTNYVIPLGQTGMLMLLLAMQMGSYFVFARRRE